MKSETQRERDKEIDRETNIGSATMLQRDRDTERHRDTEKQRHRDTETYRETDRQTGLRDTEDTKIHNDRQRQYLAPNDTLTGSATLKL